MRLNKQIVIIIPVILTQLLPCYGIGLLSFPEHGRDPQYHHLLNFKGKAIPYENLEQALDELEWLHTILTEVDEVETK